MFSNFPNLKLNSIYRAGNASFGMKVYFSAIALILSVIAFFFLSASFRNYTSKISILFIPRNEKTAVMSEQILGNMIAIPKQLSFYNKLLNDNQNIPDNFAELSDNQVENLWKKDLKIEREESSSIINIEIQRKDPEEAKTLSEATVSALFNILAHYYDIKNDVDFRIIDGPIVSSSAENLPLIILISLLLGSLASIVINFISYSISKLFGEKQEEAATGFRWSALEKKAITPTSIPKSQKNPTSQEKPASREKPIPKEKEVKIEEYKVPQSVVITPAKQSSAPGNLSFIDEEYFRNVIMKRIKKEPAKEEAPAPEIPKEGELTETPAEEAPDPHREPTQEELKKRLNQLLRGEL